MDANRVSTLPKDSSSVLNSILDSLWEYSVFALDEQGLILSWNNRALKMYQTDEFTLLGNNCSVLFHPEDISSGLVQSILTQVHRNGRWKGQIRQRCSNGETLSTLVLVILRHDAEGQLLGYSLMAREINTAVIPMMPIPTKLVPTKSRISSEALGNIGPMLVDADHKDAQAALKILVVDPDPQHGRYLTRTLRSANYATERVESAQEALAIMNTMPFSLIFINEKLPDMKASQLIDTLRQKHSELAIQFLLLSENPEMSSPNTLFKAVLNKPITLKDLRSCLENASLELSKTQPSENYAYVK